MQSDFCVSVRACAHGGKYEQSRPERVLRVLLSTFPFSVARQQQMFIWATLLPKCRGGRHGVLRRPEVTLEEKSITAQDVCETLVSQWVCEMYLVCLAARLELMASTRGDAFLLRVLPYCVVDVTYYH